MSKKKNNGANGSNGNGANGNHGHPQGEVRRAMSDAQMELLRHALVEHGKRMGALEEMINKALDDLLLMKDVVGRTQTRVKKMAEKLGIDLDDDE